MHLFLVNRAPGVLLHSGGLAFRKFVALCAILCLVSLASTPVLGHSTGENYVWLNVQGQHLEGRFEVRLEDLRSKLDIDLPTEREAAEPVLLATADRVQQYLRENFSITSNGQELPLEFTGVRALNAKGLGHFAQYDYRTPDTEIAPQLNIRNKLFFEQDPFHRSLLLIEYDSRNDKNYGKEFTALVFSPANSEQVLDFANIRGLLPTKDFIWQGMLHIWIGIDHILFLVALLIPVALVRRDNAWIPIDRFRPALWNILKVVTVFTIAHSITLALAALEIIQLPSRLVESVIALSIILVALNNIFPMFKGSMLIIVFVFGLFHGLGFASVMGQLPFRMQDLTWVILAFNVGVELGQLAIVAAIVPLIYWLRGHSIYTHAVPVYGSALLAVIATYWLVERALGIS